MRGIVTVFTFILTSTIPMVLHASFFDEQVQYETFHATAKKRTKITEIRSQYGYLVARIEDGAMTAAIPAITTISESSALDPQSTRQQLSFTKWALETQSEVVQKFGKPKNHLTKTLGDSTYAMYWLGLSQGVALVRLGQSPRVLKIYDFRDVTDLVTIDATLISQWRTYVEDFVEYDLERVVKSIDSYQCNMILVGGWWPVWF